MAQESWGELIIASSWDPKGCLGWWGGSARRLLGWDARSCGCMALGRAGG